MTSSSSAPDPPEARRGHHAGARRRATSSLIDKATFPRDKCCGDGLTTGALRRLEALGLDPSTMPSWQIVDDVVVRSVSGRTVRRSRCRATAASTRRSCAAPNSTPRWSTWRAPRAPTCARAARSRRSPTRGRRRAGRDVDGGDAIDADYVIGADGVWSTVRKLTGAADEPGYLGEWHAFRQYRKATDRRLARPVGACSKRTCGRATRGRSRSPTTSSTSASASCANRASQRRDLGRRFRDVLERPHVAAVLGDVGRGGAAEGVADSGARREDRARRARRAACCSSATRRARPIR